MSKKQNRLSDFISEPALTDGERNRDPETVSG